MTKTEDFTEHVCNLLYQISEGDCDLSEGYINEIEDTNQQAVFTGLLMLHEELGYQAEQRAEAELQLRRRQERQGALFDLAKVAIWDCDATQTIALLQELGEEAPVRIDQDDALVRSLFESMMVNAINREGLRMLGLDNFAALTSRQGDLVTAASMPVFRALWRSLAAGERRVEVQGVLPTFEGGTIEVIVGVTIPSIDEGFTIITVADVSAHHRRLAAEKAAQEKTEELSRINSEVERLFYAVSHDLRAPLRGVHNLAEWALEDMEAGDQASVVEHIGALRARVERLEQMMNDLLKYARAGRVEQGLEDVDVAALVGELPALSAVPPGFAVVASGSLPTIHTVGTLLTQVFLNLVGNAIKHHDKAEGTITISAVEQGDMVEFLVTDDGPGIPERYRERVFALFTTLQPRDAVEGSGMGLAFVQKVVRNQGGRVAIVGPDGRGTTFSFTWPRYGAETSAE